MTPSEKFNSDKNEMKSIRINRILEAAFKMFSQKGIDTIIMTDIAKASEIGVASLYRYFETKDEIAIQTAIWAWNKEKSNLLPELDNDEFNNSCGLKQVEMILRLFNALFENESDFLRFIYFFDSFIVRTGIAKERLNEYEEMIKTVQNFVELAIKKGIEDKSINCIYKDKQEVLYFTLMHTLFATAQKLTLSGKMLTMDMIVAGKIELDTLVDVLIAGIKA